MRCYWLHILCWKDVPGPDKLYKNDIPGLHKLYCQDVPNLYLWEMSGILASTILEGEGVGPDVPDLGPINCTSQTSLIFPHKLYKPDVPDLPHKLYKPNVPDLTP